MGLLDYAKERIALWRFQRTPLAQALRSHTQEYFYSGQALSWMEERNRQGLIADLMSKIGGALEAENPTMALRERLAEYILLYAGLAVLCLTEAEKAQQFFATSPYISGQLHHEIDRAAPLNDELARLAWQGNAEVSIDELMALANTRSAVALFYVNGLNMARISIGDTDEPRDWFRPFVEAMCIWEEDNYREKLNAPRLMPGGTHGMPYYLFMEYVFAGERNPWFTFEQAWPDLPLGAA